MKTVDCFMFFNELDLLEMRLEYLEDVIDYFILVEAKFTQLGGAKELFYDINKDRYKKYHDKIIHIVVESPISEEYCMWENENYQRNCITKGLSEIELKDDDVIIISDLDEFPSKEAIAYYIENDCLFTSGMTQDMYYYFMNYKAGYKWNGSVIFRAKEILKNDISPQDIRDMRQKVSKIPVHGGWHFSYMGGAEEVLTKITSVCESNYHEKYKDTRILQGFLDSNTVHFNNCKLSRVDINNKKYPDTIVKKWQKYSHLFKME